MKTSALCPPLLTCVNSETHLVGNHSGITHLSCAHLLAHQAHGQQSVQVHTTRLHKTARHTGTYQGARCAPTRGKCCRDHSRLTPHQGGRVTPTCA